MDSKSSHAVNQASPRKLRPKVAVVGSANIDLTTFTEKLPRAGETIFASKFDLGFGGKGANQAVAARLCGAEVAMVARVGNDLFGPATIENFRRQGIDTSHVRQIDGISSGVAPIFVDEAGQNRILVVRGANDELRPTDVDSAAEVLKQADCILLQFEIPLETVYHTIHFAKENSIRCIVNPAPIQAVDLERLSGLDFFVPNESEAEEILGSPMRALDDAENCARRLLDHGIRHVVITLGSNGSFLASTSGVHHIRPFPVATIDTAGAGDAFIGSFSVFLSEGFSEVDAANRANFYAALSTTGIGTQKSFWTRARFESEWAARLANCF